MRLHDSVFVSDSATVSGNVSVGRGSSIWPGAVVRGDRGLIKIGKCVNIQDNCVLHRDGGHSLEVGDYVSVGHGAIIHGARICDNVMVGMGAIVMDGAVVGEDCIVGAGAVVTQGFAVPPRSLVLGVPGRVVRGLSGDEVEGIKKNAREYVKLARKAKDKI